MQNAQNDQMIAFLGGLPGAGKSQVIRAIQVLADKWGYPDSVATTAYQGVAAQAAGGETIHKLFGWTINGPRRNWSPTIEQKERFLKLKLLIIDEISTTDVKLLGVIDMCLCRLLSTEGLPFGGIHVLLVGDWLQQLPVLGQPAFQKQPQYSTFDQANQNCDTNAYLSRLRGIKAYQNIYEVVMLDENMSHHFDQIWKNILARWRFGNYLAEDIDFVNDTCYYRNWTDNNHTLQAFCPIIVTSNTLRAEFNTKSIQAFCNRTNRPLHKYNAILSRVRYSLTD